jgi:hypothetical protein
MCTKETIRVYQLSWVKLISSGISFSLSTEIG